MKRFVMAIALACVLSGSAVAGEVHSGGAPAPGDIPTGGIRSSGEIPLVPGEMPMVEFLLAILGLAI